MTKKKEENVEVQAIPKLQAKPSLANLRQLQTPTKPKQKPLLLLQQRQPSCDESEHDYGEDDSESFASRYYGDSFTSPKHELNDEKHPMVLHSYFSSSSLASNLSSMTSNSSLSSFSSTGLAGSNLSSSTSKDSLTSSASNSSSIYASSATSGTSPLSSRKSNFFSPEGLGLRLPASPSLDSLFTPLVVQNDSL